MASAGAIAVAAGPLIGGLFTTYALVAAGSSPARCSSSLVILALTRRMADTPADPDAKLDLVGTVLSALGLGLIVYGDPPRRHLGVRAAEAGGAGVVRASRRWSG